MAKVASALEELPGADPAALERVGDMQVLQERTPGGVVLEDRVSEADDGTVMGRDDGAHVRPRLPKPRGPHRRTVDGHVAVEVGV